MPESFLTLDTDSSSESLRPCVRFNPGLSDQRQIFLLDVLRRYNPESVLDIGCGEGALVEAVCRPPFALSVSPDFDTRHGINPDAETKCSEDLYRSLNISHIAGLDISEDLLRGVTETVKGMDSTIHSNHTLQLNNKYRCR
jgi:small RNA 2'-O-methyltransferase